MTRHEVNLHHYGRKGADTHGGGVTSEFFDYSQRAVRLPMGAYTGPTYRGSFVACLS